MPLPFLRLMKRFGLGWVQLLNRVAVNGEESKRRAKLGASTVRLPLWCTPRAGHPPTGPDLFGRGTAFLTRKTLAVTCFFSCREELQASESVDRSSLWKSKKVSWDGNELAAVSLEIGQTSHKYLGRHVLVTLAHTFPSGI